MDQMEEFLAPPEPVEEPLVTEEFTPEPEPAVVDPAPAAEPPDVQGLKQAVLAERRRRQELEQALAQKQEEEKPFLGEEYENRFKETEERFNWQLTQQKRMISEAFTRDKYADFDEKIDMFVRMAQENPMLISQMDAQTNPAEFAYKTAMNQQKLKEMGDPSQYEKKLREQITAELEAKYKAQLEAENKKRNELPGSLATTRGSAGTQAPAWQGPTSLDDMLK